MVMFMSSLMSKVAGSKSIEGGIGFKPMGLGSLWGVCIFAFALGGSLQGWFTAKDGQWRCFLWIRALYNTHASRRRWRHVLNTSFCRKYVQGLRAWPDVQLVWHIQAMKMKSRMYERAYKKDRL